VSGAAVSLYTATVCAAVVTSNPAQSEMPTATSPSASTLASATVHVVPEPESVPFVAAPVPFAIIISSAASPEALPLNVISMPVLSAVPELPPTCAAV
jgi:hypothetical protein